MKGFSRLIAKVLTVDLRGNTKQDVLRELVDAIAATAEITDKNDFLREDRPPLLSRVTGIFMIKTII